MIKDKIKKIFLIRKNNFAFVLVLFFFSQLLFFTFVIAGFVEPSTTPFFIEKLENTFLDTSEKFQIIKDGTLVITHPNSSSSLTLSTSSIVFSSGGDRGSAIISFPNSSRIKFFKFLDNNSNNNINLDLYGGTASSSDDFNFVVYEKNNNIENVGNLYLSGDYISFYLPGRGKVNYPARGSFCGYARYLDYGWADLVKCQDVDISNGCPEGYKPVMFMYNLDFPFRKMLTCVYDP